MSAKRRKLRACDFCRTKKVKCNRLQPCATCLQFGVECHFSMHLEVDELKWSALDLRDYTIRDYLHQHKSEPLSTRPLEPLELSEDTMQYLLSVFCDQFSEESFQPYLPIVRILLDPVHGPMLSRDAIITCAATHAQRLGKSEQDRIGKISLQRYYHSLFSSTETQSLIDIVCQVITGPSVFYNFPGSTFFWSRMLIVNSQHLREPANSPLLDCLRINTMWLLKIANVFYSSFLLKQPDLAYCYPEMPFPASIENDMKPDWTHAVAIQPWNPYVVTGSLDLNGTYCTLHLIQVKILETRIKGVDYYEIESICCALQDWYDYFSTLSYQDTLKSNIWYSLAETEYYWLHLLLFLPHLKRYLTRPSKTASLNVNRCLRAIRMISIIFRSFAEEISFDMLPPHTTQVLAHCCIGQCLVIKYLNIETITESTKQDLAFLLGFLRDLQPRMPSSKVNLGLVLKTMTHLGLDHNQFQHQIEQKQHRIALY